MPPLPAEFRKNLQLRETALGLPTNTAWVGIHDSAYLDE